MNIAIIGSNGFIGKHLTRKLAEQKIHKLFLFGRSTKPSYESNFPYKKIDFFNTSQLQTDFEGIDVVYYLASETIPSSSWNNPLLELEKNLIPFVKFIDAIVKLQIKKLVFVSSAGTVYGPTSGKVSEDANKQPFSPYGIVKLSMENFLNYYRTKYQLQSDIYRVSNVYGEGQDTSKGLGIINTFLEKIIHTGKVEIFGDGQNTRNYIYVNDVAELLSRSLLNLNRSEVYNLSSNETYSINELVDMMREIVNENFEAQYTGSRQSDNSFIDLDNTKLQQEFNSFKFTGIREGIQKTYTVLKENAIHKNTHGQN